MTAPAPSGGPSPLRVGGLALIAVGVVAGLIGLGTLASGTNGTAAAVSPTVTVAPSPEPAPPAPTPEPAPPAPSPAPAPTNDATVPVPSFGPTPTNAIAAPPPPTSAPAPAANSSDGSYTRSPLRVYNNSTISGLAARAADDFRSGGWPVEQVANYPQGVIPTSTVYYRPGTNEQAAAAALAGQFGLRVEPRFEGLTESSPGLIVIVTNDYKGS